MLVQGVSSVHTHCCCLRLVTGSKALAVSLAGSLSRAKLVTCRRYEYKGCEEWEGHADNKIQWGGIKWRSFALLTEPFPGNRVRLIYFMVNGGMAASPLTLWINRFLPRNWIWTIAFFYCLLCLLGLGTGRTWEVEVEHGLGHPQRFYRAHHTQAAPSQRQSGGGPQTHADIHCALCHR